jgi:predicted DNA-binding transcriptional regulator AlpA
MDNLLKIKDILEKLSIGRSALERMRNDNTFPQPDLYLGRKSPRWSLVKTVMASTSI